MKLRYRILGGGAILLVLGLAALAIAMSYESPCGASPPASTDPQRMKAFVSRCYGSPQVLKLEEIAKPVPKDDEVLVKIHAASLNPLDWHGMRGEPYIVRLPDGLGAPEDTRIGVDFAGTVEGVGKNITRFKPGDEIFGGKSGAFAEFVVVRENRVTLKPAGVTFEQAAAVPIAALTALQGLRDKGQVHAGTRVLINGASGGVGTFAVQIAKSLGAEVTGVCSTRNLELVRSLGADHVIDYTKEDYASSEQLYDVIIDNVGNRTLADNRRVLKSDGALVIIGAGSRDPWIGPMALPLKASLMAPFVSQRMGMFIARMDSADLKVMADLMQAGKVTPVIDRRYPLSELPAAMEYLETGRARGKIIVNIVEPTEPAS